MVSARSSLLDDDGLSTGGDCAGEGCAILMDGAGFWRGDPRGRLALQNLFSLHGGTVPCRKRNGDDPGESQIGGSGFGILLADELWHGGPPLGEDEAQVPERFSAGAKAREGGDL